MVKHLTVTSALIVALLFTGCGIISGDNSNNDLPESQLYANANTDHDLEIKSIALHKTNLGDEEVVDNTVYTGHAIEVIYNLHSASDSPGETVVYFYLGDADHYKTIIEVSEEGTETSGHFLGSEHISAIHEGDNNFTIRLFIPKEVEEGTHRIYVHVDPHNQIEEYDEGDNHYTPDAEDISVEVVVDSEKEDSVDIHLDSLRLTHDNILIDHDNDVHDDADLSTHPYHGNYELEGDLKIHVLNNDNDILITTETHVLIDGTWHDLEMWDNDAQGYKNSLSNNVAPLTSSKYIHLQVNVPEDTYNALIEKMLSSGNNEFVIRVQVNSDTETHHSLNANNYIYKTIKVFDFNPSPKIVKIPSNTDPVTAKIKEATYYKESGDEETIKVSTELYGNVLVNQVDAIMGSRGDMDINLHVYGITIGLINGYITTICTPNNALIGSAANMKLYNRNIINWQFENYSDPEKNIDESVAVNVAIAKLSFTVGPWPMSVSLRAIGEVGLSAELEWKNGTFSTDKGPWAGIYAGADGAIFDIIIASAGAEVDLSLIKDELHITSSMTPVFSDDLKITKVSGNFAMTNDISTLDGWLYLYVKTLLGTLYELTLFDFEGIIIDKETLYNQPIDDLL